ncbi:MAG: TPR repeat containing exported protein [Flavobacteriaceae bacterium FS1-H7996/R]|nr:MAG: TPR repeat containing exported protein [Flavobacteriaceae bacterium FS1-H7996/R]
MNTAFSTWVTAQTNAFAIANGCSPVLDNDSASVTVPELCTGGTATVKWTISDLCETIEVSADFNLTAPTAITYTAPEDDSSTACEFDLYDAIIAQSSLNADITAWVNNQTSIINTSLEGGCSPIVTNDFASQSIDFCTGGSLTITWQVQDLCGISTSTATYTYTKPTPVALDQQNLPSNITVECDNIPNADVLTASTNCGEVNVIYNETRINGECASYYELVRTWKATDICGSSVEHTQTITVQDTTPPVLSLPVNVSAECSDDLSPIAFGSATATDNCDDNPAISYEDKRTDGACSGTYTITRTWKATDACGNEATADQVISISDTTAPEFVETNLPGNVTVECTAVPAAETLTATDNCGTATVTVNDVRADGNCVNNYTITRTWIATDECGLTKTHIQTITVQDTTPPTFVETLPPTNLVVECDAVPVAETLTATDNCGSATVSVNDARTNGSCPKNYTLTRTWTATDECGNTTKHTQIITVQDTKAPQFVQTTLPTNITVACDAIPTAETLTATDNCGTATVSIIDAVTNGDCPNNYIIARTWTATDECGLITKHTQIITVQDTQAPVPTATFDEVLNVSCTNIPQAPALTFTDNCSSSANIVVVFNETNTFQDNVYNDYEIVRTWTVRDACGNEAVYKQILIVTLDQRETYVDAGKKCFDDGIVNLNDFVPSTLNTNGTWELIEGNPAATLTGSIFNPTTLELGDDFLPDSGGMDYKFWYTTTDNGCISITEVTMNINADCVVLPCGENDVAISKAVTPNGDAYNESFDITGIELCGFTADVKIFNRWGALIFESNSYTVGENMGEWKGSASKKSIGAASTVPNGTYYYIVTLKDSGLAPFTGPVYLGTK